jgi:hypothetical protein
MKEKTYVVSEGFEDGKHFYDIAYRVNEHTDKEIRFSYIEHCLQFIDLLHEARYYPSESGDNPYA